MAESIKTPKKTVISHSRGPGSIFSTPGNPNSSATAQALKAWTADDVRPLLTQDIKGFRLGDLDRYLYRILRAVGAIDPCVVNEKEVNRPSEDVILSRLKGCLKAIDESVKAKTDELAVIQEALTKYSETKGEVDRYQYFVRATNKIFDLLEGVKVGNSRDAATGDNQLRFLVHDPKTIPSQHGKKTCRRKPDIILAKKEFVAPLYPSPKERGETKETDATNPNSLEYLETAPPKSLAWAKGLMYLEFKKRSNGVLEPPVPWSSVLEETEVGTYETPDDIENEANPRTEVTSQAQVVTQTMPSSGGSKETRTRSQASQRSDASKKRQREDDVLPSADTQASSTDTRGSKKVKLSEPVTPAAVQLGEYAALSLYNTFGRNHVLGLLITDARINIWHFDHDSPMQMTGFDFLKNQNYLFLFLFALQRFNDKDWGFLPGFEKFIGKDDIELELQDSWVHNPNGVKRTFTGEVEEKPRYGLAGRATGVLFGSVAEQDVAVKLSWPEKNRAREKTFIDEARRRLDEKNFPDYQPTDYLPDILAAQEYAEFESGPLREAVLRDEQEYERFKLGSRVPYLLVMPKYKPIATLTADWDKFMRAFYALFYCHAMLWSVGIRHGDISESNLMWDPATDKAKLCDFDLSHFCPPPEIGLPEIGPDGPLGLSNTGTWIFMASELLTIPAMAGCVKRVYRHEVEAFVAVLLWISRRYERGELMPNPPFEGWKHTDYVRVEAQRKASLQAVVQGKGDIPKPPSLRDDLRDEIDATVSDMIIHQARASSLRANLAFNERFPNKPPRILSEPLEDWDDLRTLRTKILTSWGIFTLPSASLFVRLMNERILNAPENEQT